ncbi:hypothetical protein TREMEDRAFT_62780 [Tremella mesenterica DSM 1558]|uniref:uncharacterized protein n=1 Tax=Tremella mesenterica (strain ATCC 24925 / CBS 8224 / DSM 1558 / NBRC 9311 / NRRL Y-6157 / RJB 2259-6 / UBC 559-6) TaxID=578456 RepID=UPI0003F4917D|nr:uncharacterized protein TREMEDRAFT_62780 [Tremella mesenterica DSM 1558]EIW69052.1 hypothetical protein TREMEDRAFT_62780 [Tremella mesenterica DSM 1558]
MSYPSIISQPGSAERNLFPILEALKPLLSFQDLVSSPELPISPLHTTHIESSHNTEESGPSTSSFNLDTINKTRSSLRNHDLSRTSGTKQDEERKKRKLLEIASGEHIPFLAKIWGQVEWYGSVRDIVELRKLESYLAHHGDIPNLLPIRILDISSEHHWEGLRDDLQGEMFEGVLIINLIHCLPPESPENIFRQLSPFTQPRLLGPFGWISVYGPWLTDDGLFRSENDEKFDRTHLKSQHPSLGLRSITSIDTLARKWGFGPSERREMPSGNTWVVWRAGC